MKLASGLFFKSLMLVGMRVLASGCALILTWLIARNSVQELGIFRTLFVYFIICEWLPLLGMQAFLVREISVHPQETKKYGFHALVFSLGVAVIGALALCGLASFGGYSTEVKDGMYVVAAGLPAMSANLVAVSILIGVGQATKYGMIQGCETIVRTAAGIACLSVGWGVIPVITAMIVARWLVVLGYWRVIQPILSKEPRKFDVAFFRDFLRNVPTFAGITIMAAVARFAPQTMLPWILSDTAAGQFAAAYIFIDVVMMGPTALMTNLGPVFARKAKESATGLLDSCRQGIKTITLIVAPMVAIGSALSRPMFETIFPLSQAYAVSARVLELIIWSCWLQVIDMVLAITIVARGEQHIDLQSLSVGAVTLVVLLGLLLPEFGVMGAAYAMLGGILAQVGVRLILVSRRLIGLRPLELVWRAVIAAGAATVATAYASHVHWLMGIVAGGVSYLLVLSLVGGLVRDERAAIGRFLQTGKA